MSDPKETVKGDLASISAGNWIDIQTIFAAAATALDRIIELERELAAKDAEIAVAQGVATRMHERWNQSEANLAAKDVHIGDLEKSLSLSRTEVKDHERWLKEMCDDYRLAADDHTLSWRLAINGFIHAQRAELAAKDARIATLEQTCKEFADDETDYMRERAEKDARLLEARGHIALLLPMAKGYAALHPTVRVNQEIIEAATEEARAALASDDESLHRSDCAIYNEPAYPAGECDCGALASDDERG